MRKLFLVVHREPIVERVPNLKGFIEFAASNNNLVTLITSSSSKFPSPVFNSKHIKLIDVAERTKLFELPTILKIMFALFREIVFSREKNNALIFAGRGALVINGVFSKLISYKARIVSFVVEYPNVIENKAAGVIDRLELKGIESSDFYITHDKYHSDVIERMFVGKKPKALFLPNSTISPVSNMGGCASSYLHDNLGLQTDTKILLHSGGFGEWFSSRELASQSKYLDDDKCMVFHASHNINHDDYFQESRAELEALKKVRFSLNPVSSSDLDKLVASAFIGIAWYNVDKLGFRAVYMGLAAGKIGSYLKCGVPVIAPKIDSLSYIEQWKCGVLIESLDHLKFAIENITRDHHTYKSNAIKCYEDLWEPEQYLSRIVSCISN